MNNLQLIFWTNNFVPDGESSEPTVSIDVAYLDDADNMYKQLIRQYFSTKSKLDGGSIHNIPKYGFVNLSHLYDDTLMCAFPFNRGFTPDEIVDIINEKDFTYTICFTKIS